MDNDQRRAIANGRRQANGDDIAIARRAVRRDEALRRRGYSVLSVEPWALERRENSSIERSTGIFTRGRPCLRPSWIS